MSNAIEQAYQALQQGRERAAVDLLERAGENGNADAFVELAVWALTGQALPRDLALARACFGKAGALGHDRAAEIYCNLTGNGVGGARDWAAAKELLAARAKHSPGAAIQLALLSAMNIDADGQPLEVATFERLSVSPDVRLVRNFLTAAESTYLIAQAEPLFAPSMVVDPVSGRMAPHPFRTSDNTEFPWVEEDLAIHVINRRIAALTGTPVENGEPLQVLRYRGRQEYRPHYDAIEATDNQRVLTVLLYLNEDYDGGETRFCRNALDVKGQRGDALIFVNADHDGRPDPNAQHAGLPVRSGEKLIATRWIRQRRFGPLS